MGNRRYSIYSIKDGGEKLRTAAKNGHEESVSYVAKNQRLGRISLLFTNGV